MKKLLLAGILLLSTLFGSATTLFPKCGDQNSFTFTAYNGPAGMGQVVIVDQNNAQVGTYTQQVILTATGITEITVPRINYATVRIRLTWPNGTQVSFSESTNVICGGLPIKVPWFNVTNQNNGTVKVEFTAVAEDNVSYYRVKTSTDNRHWITKIVIQADPAKYGYYVTFIKP